MCIKVQEQALPTLCRVIVAIEYVFPSTSGFSLRGNLDERWALAKAAGCTYVEIPADFIKNRKEVAATGQELCAPLTRKSIGILYTPIENPAVKIPYILHTEPSLGRTDKFGITHQTALEWHNRKWVDDLVKMLLNISRQLGHAPEMIEIHPGDRRNSFADIANGVRSIQNAFLDSFSVMPEILLENRTGQFISDGASIAQFWKYLLEKNPDITGKFGIILDVQQLATVTHNRFNASFKQIPSDCLKGFHIHRGSHKPPHENDGMPWDIVFTRISGLQHDVIINPEILHKNEVPEVIGFCNRMLNRPR